MMREKPNYLHNDDYDAPDVEWLNVSTIGSSYEEEMSLNRNPTIFRHRNPYRFEPWKYGKAPNND